MRTYFQTGNYFINFFLKLYYILFLAQIIVMTKVKDNLDLISMTAEELQAYLDKSKA